MNNENDKPEVARHIGAGVKANLRGADLRGINLSGADLRWPNKVKSSESSEPCDEVYPKSTQEPE